MEVRDRRAGLWPVLLALLPLLPSFWFTLARPWLPALDEKNTRLISMPTHIALIAAHASNK